MILCEKNKKKIWHNIFLSKIKYNITYFIFYFYYKNFLFLVTKLLFYFLTEFYNYSDLKKCLQKS